MVIIIQSLLLPTEISQIEVGEKAVVVVEVEEEVRQM